MSAITTFDTNSRYIIFPIFVTTRNGTRQKFNALLDTGAPTTEFSDEALQHIGFLKETKQDVQLKSGFQTQKYGKITLPCVEICSYPVNNMEVYVSHFDKSWGIKALIGLNFFRQFKVTIDYKLGQIITEPLV